VTLAISNLAPKITTSVDALDYMAYNQGRVTLTWSIDANLVDIQVFSYEHKGTLKNPTIEFVKTLVAGLPNKGSESFSPSNVAPNAVAVILRIVPTGGDQVFAMTKVGADAPVTTKPLIQEQFLENDEAKLEEQPFAKHWN